MPDPTKTGEADAPSAPSTVPTIDSNTTATGCHGSGLMTRAQAAAMANVSVSTVRRWEGTVLPTVVGDDGVHRFRQEHVREIVERRVQTTPAAADAYDGSTAAAVYALFDDGQNPADVVKSTGLHPHAVTAVHEQWASMRGGFFVDGKVACEISSLDGLATGELIRDGVELLRRLRRRPPLECVECCDGVASLYARCAKELKLRELARRSAEEQRRKQEQVEGREKLEMEKAFRDLLAARRNAKSQPK